MRRFHLSSPSPALVVSSIALVVALGGTSYAAFTLPRNSVGTRQLRNNAVTAAKLHNGAVNGRSIARGAVGTDKIANGAVTGAKLKLAGVTVPSAANAAHAVLADSATHASTADSATRATSADSATRATNADNAAHAATADSATLLGGNPASSFLPSSAIISSGVVHLTAGDSNKLLARTGPFTCWALLGSS